MFMGIEIGGTKLQLGIGRGDGDITALWRGAVNPTAGGDGIRAQIVAAVPELLVKAGIDRGSLRGVGIGLCAVHLFVAGSNDSFVPTTRPPVWFLPSGPVRSVEPPMK